MTTKTVEHAITVLLAEWEIRGRPSEPCALAITLKECAHHGRRFLRFACRGYIPGSPPARELIVLPVNWSEASAVYTALQGELCLLREAARQQKEAHGRRTQPFYRVGAASDRARRFARVPARATG